MIIFDSNPCGKYNLDDVGDGYRSVAFLPPNNYGGKSGTGHMVLFGFDKQGNEKTFVFPFCPSVKYEVNRKTSEKDLYGKYIETKWFDDTNSRRRWCEENEDKVKIITCYQPEQEFLVDIFGPRVYKHLDDGKLVVNSDFNNQKLRYHFFDIEIAIENEFPEPKDAKYPINLITVYDNFTEKFYSWALDQTISNTITEYPVELRKFHDEKDLLMDYVEWNEQNRPSVLIGYNSKFFDLYYIMRRLENVFGKKVAKRMSPVGKYRYQIDKKNYNKTFATVQGVSNIDFMFLYRDKFMIKASLDGGYSLNNVAKNEVNDQKIHYDGSMLDFYKQNFQKFWEYNVQDVNLVVKLEEKLKLVSIARKITSFGCAPLEAIYGTISYIVSSLDIYSRVNFNRYFSTYSKINKDHNTEKYRGAFVFPTYAGLYKQGVGTVDVNSLYPSTARCLNLSPETLVGMLKEREDGSKYIETPDKDSEHNITEEQLNELLETKCILAKNNALFLKHEVKRGIFAEWCGEFFNLRKTFKKALAKNEEAIRNLKQEQSSIENITEEQKQAFKKKIYDIGVQKEINHATQYALKILINSAYGTLGTSFSPIYDVRLAEAITMNGQFCNRSTSVFINKLFQKEYNCPTDFNVTISGDTDSVTGDTMLDIRFNENILGFSIKK